MTLIRTTNESTRDSGQRHPDRAAATRRQSEGRPALRLLPHPGADATSPHDDPADEPAARSAANRLFGARAAAATTHADAQVLVGVRPGENRVRLRTRSCDAKPVIGLDLVDRLRRELEAHALAEETRRSYRHHQAAWRAWCEDHQIDPEAASDDEVAQHLVAYLVVGAETGEVERGEDDELLAAVTVASVRLRLAAIDRSYADAGRARPGRSRAVRTLMEGVRRLYGVAPVHAKQPILLPDLRDLIRWIRADDELMPARDLVLAYLRRTARATPGQLARLDWARVEIGEVDAYVALPPDRRGGERRRVRVRASRGPATCPVAALRRLRSWLRAEGPVFTAADGTRLTRQAIDKHLRRRVDGSGEEVRGDTPRPSTKALRDQALLTCGWFAALRRSNLTALRWSDLSWDPDGNVRVRLRRTKTDQHGQGSYNWLPVIPNEVACPASAITAWRARMTEVLGSDPVMSSPEARVFPSMNRHDQISLKDGIPRRLRGEAINELVQELVIGSGLTAPPEKGARNPYGGHSLRSGLVTESVRAGVPLLEITKITHHADPRGLVSYNKPEERGQLTTLRAVVGAG